MKISVRNWVFFAVFAAVAFVSWHRFAYPRFSIMDFSVNREAAVSAASEYLAGRGVRVADYRSAVIFDDDQWADRYLQRTLGNKDKAFVKEHDYELFYWIVRFYKPLSKEEYRIVVSPRTASVIKFAHLIEDVAERPAMDKDAARAAAEKFLGTACGINFSEFSFHEEKATKLDHRTDYYFSWEKNGVYIPSPQGEGGAKLLTSVTVSGGEVLNFYKNRLDVPESFERYVQRQSVFGESLFSIYFLSYITMVGWAVSLLVKRRQHLVIRMCKKWYIYLGFFFVAVNSLYIFNNLNLVHYSYPTSTSPASYFWLTLIKELTDSLFLSVMFVIPGIVGESLREEVFPQRVQSSVLHYLRSTFFSRNVFHSVLLGYLLCVIMLGIQAAIFRWGQEHLGVWREWIRMTQFSSSYMPALSALAMAATAAVSEETVFRLFGISLFTKYFKKAAYAVVLTSFIWGFGHSAYAIFPVWFRGIEVGIVGCLFGVIFLRFGIIPVLTAHYLFDAFWGTAPYILSRSPAVLACSAVFILLLPLFYALYAFIKNLPEKERDLAVYLDKIQMYNLAVVQVFIKSRREQGLQAADIRRELIAHNWDVDLVDRALEKS